jgi:hypothetical protein
MCVRPISNLVFCFLAGSLRYPFSSIEECQQNAVITSHRWGFDELVREILLFDSLVDPYLQQWMTKTVHAFIQWRGQEKPAREVAIWLAHRVKNEFKSCDSEAVMKFVRSKTGQPSVKPSCSCARDCHSYV